MKGLLKWPLIIAAVAVVGRVILEQSGAPPALSNAVSVVVLSLLIFPLYFAIRIANSGVAGPYAALFKTIALYAALARAMVIPTYWLAYIYQWPQPRFSLEQGGVVGPDVTPLMGYVLIPGGALLAWIVASLVIGGGLGSMVIAIKRRSAKKASNPVAAR